MLMVPYDIHRVSHLFGLTIFFFSKANFMVLPPFSRNPLLEKKGQKSVTSEMVKPGFYLAG
jgi:hypothetical protein